MEVSTARGRSVNGQAKQIKKIEATQRSLRESIEVTKTLAEKAEDLLQKHKRTIQAEEFESSGKIAIGQQNSPFAGPKLCNGSRE